MGTDSNKKSNLNISLNKDNTSYSKLELTVSESTFGTITIPTTKYTVLRNNTISVSLIHLYNYNDVSHRFIGNRNFPSSSYRSESKVLVSLRWSNNSLFVQYSFGSGAADSCIFNLGALAEYY